jgi:hypothetical protein
MNRDDPFIDSRVPRSLCREGRIEMLGEAAEALLQNRTAPKEAAFFLGSAIQAWLEHGGDLERTYLKVRRRGSHRTVQAIYRELQNRPRK